MSRRRSRWLWLGLLWAFAVQAQEAGPAPVDSGLWVGIMITDAVDGGGRLAAVIPSGPADRAGLRPGDVLIRIDEQPVSGRDSIRAYLAAQSNASPVVITFLRAGKSKTATVYPERRGPEPTLPIEFTTSFIVRPTVAIKLTSMTPELREHYGAPLDRGLLLLKMEDGGSAAEAGFQVGDILLEACGGALDSEQTWSRCLQRSVRKGEVSVLRLRKGEQETLTLTMPRVRLGPIMETLVSSEDMRDRRRDLLETEIQRLKSMLIALQSEYDRLSVEVDAEATEDR